MWNRYNNEQDRVGDREYGRRDYPRQRFDNEVYRRERAWRERQTQFERDDANQFTGGYRERDYDREFGTRLEPGYRMRSRYAGRYEPRYPDRDYERELPYGRRRHVSDYDRRRDFSYDRDYNGPSRDQERGWWERMSDEVASWFGDEEAERRRRMDEIREGTHRGKGPRGYKRSDERIKEEVNDCLTDYSHLDASDIEVTVTEGVVTLDGRVDSRWAKRSAEDIVETVSGVRDIRNNLLVGRAASQAVDTGSELLGTTGSKTRAKGA